ncbi:MAG TPA: BolA family protein [Candidatus Nanoarchaeia archaeon]|nr:BolA family protein [Candidatus Nanoarchaeia archaeon]
MPTSEEIKEKIENGLPDSEVEVLAVRNDGMHFKAIVKSREFEGKPLIEQHRMVYNALGEAFKKGLHSLSIEIKE